MEYRAGQIKAHYKEYLLLKIGMAKTVPAVLVDLALIIYSYSVMWSYFHKDCQHGWNA